MSTLWSGRFAGEPDADVFNFGKSLPVDRRLIEDDITGVWHGPRRSPGRRAVLDEATRIVTGLEPSGTPCDPIRRCWPMRPMRTSILSSSANWWRIGETGAPAHRPLAQRTGVRRFPAYLRRRIPVLQQALAGWSVRWPIKPGAPVRRSCPRIRIFAGRSRCRWRTCGCPTSPPSGAITRAWRPPAASAISCRSARAQSRVRAMTSTPRRSPRASVSRPSPRTASTRRVIATSWPRFSTPAR